jgi:heme oxygenase
MKYYFREDDDETCYLINHWKRFLEENQLDTIKLFEQAKKIDAQGAKRYFKLLN